VEGNYELVYYIYRGYMFMLNMRYNNNEITWEKYTLLCILLVIGTCFMPCTFKRLLQARLWVAI